MVSSTIQAPRKVAEPPEDVERPEEKKGKSKKDKTKKTSDPITGEDGLK